MYRRRDRTALFLCAILASIFGGLLSNEFDPWKQPRQFRGGETIWQPLNSGAAGTGKLIVRDGVDIRFAGLVMTGDVMETSYDTIPPSPSPQLQRLELQASPDKAIHIDSRSLSLPSLGLHGHWAGRALLVGREITADGLLYRGQLRDVDPWQAIWESSKNNEPIHFSGTSGSVEWHVTGQQSDGTWPQQPIVQSLRLFGTPAALAIRQGNSEWSISAYESAIEADPTGPHTLTLSDGQLTWQGDQSGQDKVTCHIQGQSTVPLIPGTAKASDGVTIAGDWWHVTATHLRAEIDYQEGSRQPSVEEMTLSGTTDKPVIVRLSPSKNGPVSAHGWIEADRVALAPDNVAKESWSLQATGKVRMNFTLPDGAISVPIRAEAAKVTVVFHWPQDSANGSKNDSASRDTNDKKEPKSATLETITMHGDTHQRAAFYARRDAKWFRSSSSTITVEKSPQLPNGTQLQPTQIRVKMGLDGRFATVPADTVPDWPANNLP